MILFTAAAIKILVFILTLVLCYRIFSERLDKKQLIFLGILVTIFACCANYIANLLPPLTDTVTLTALGEKREEARGMEVYLNGYTIDGEEYLAGKSLEIESGHWFWSGETYAWRPETDSRQPDGMTRTVVLKIPVGWDRTLNFSSSEWRGLVQIDDGYNVWVEDTYAEKSSIKVVQIAKSEIGVLLANQVRYVAVYTAIMLLIVFGSILLFNKVLHNEPESKEWFCRNNSKFIYACIAFITLLLMFHYAGNISFWYDELYEVAFTNGSLKEALMHCLYANCDNPPLVVLLETLWYHIVPYGEPYLLLVSIIPVCIAIFIMGVICEKIADKYCGILAAILMATSITIWNYAAYEYRSYACMVLFSTLTLYIFIKRNENKNQKKWTILFSLSMAALAMTHYFGILACIWFACADGYLLIKRELKIKDFIPYSFLAIVCLIWFAFVFIYKHKEGIPAWHSVPNLLSIKSLLYFISGDYELTFWLFVFGIATSIILYSKENIYKVKWIRFYCVFSLFAITSSILLLFLYGNFINTNAPLWTNRYFLFLIPYVCLLSVSSISFIKTDYKKVFCIFFLLVLTLNCFSVVSTSKSNEPFREAADWIYTQSNYIYNDDTLIVCNANRLIAESWQEYYISRQGKRNDIQVITQYDISEEQLLQYNRIYIQYSHGELSPNLQTILDNNYKLGSDNRDVQVRVYVRK